MDTTFYSSPLWAAARARALSRDDSRCTVARLLGGRCSSVLHVHHIVPLEEGGAAYDLDNLGTSCSAHHPAWEALRRALVDRRDRWVRCPHQHRSAEARRQCELRLNRSRAVA